VVVLILERFRVWDRMEIVRLWWMGWMDGCHVWLEAFCMCWQASKVLYAAYYENENIVLISLLGIIDKPYEDGFPFVSQRYKRFWQFIFEVHEEIFTLIIDLNMTNRLQYFDWLFASKIVSPYRWIRYCTKTPFFHIQ
jgi:hypothetical protein